MHGRYSSLKVPKLSIGVNSVTVFSAGSPKLWRAPLNSSQWQSIALPTEGKEVKVQAVASGFSRSLVLCGSGQGTVECKADGRVACTKSFVQCTVLGGSISEGRCLQIRLCSLKCRDYKAVGSNRYHCFVAWACWGKLFTTKNRKTLISSKKDTFKHTRTIYFKSPSSKRGLALTCIS